jgi:hypothetical protein
VDTQYVSRDDMTDHPIRTLFIWCGVLLAVLGGAAIPVVWFLWHFPGR